MNKINNQQCIINNDLFLNNKTYKISMNFSLIQGFFPVPVVCTCIEMLDDVVLSRFKIDIFISQLNYKYRCYVVVSPSGLK